jgi:GntR family transcriptional regulator
VLDRFSPLSLHEQLRRMVQDDIVSGRLAAGERLPTEREFCERFEVSRITVTRALGDLARLGLIERVQGRGSVVAKGRVLRSFDQVIGLTDSLRTQGLTTHSEVLAFERVERDRVPADLQSLVPECPPAFMRLQRLRYVDGRRAVLSTSFIPWALGAQIDPDALATGSLYGEFERILGLPITRNDQVTTLVLANRDIARKLNVKLRSAHFLFRGSAHAENRLVELTNSVFRGDLFEFKASMRRASVRQGSGTLP